MDIGLRSYRISIIFLNLLVVFIVLLFKDKYALLFLANTIVCGLLITFFWNYYIETHPFSSTEYHFEYKNKNHILHIENNPDFYSISYAKDSIKSIHLGMHEEKGDSTLLKDWDYKKQQYINMYFYKDTLIAFQEKGTKIKVTEINK